ncbi:MAG: hypothetical protein Q4G68_03465 [Planctomycetia bacterium]|nr:hypothetical protein [Planctomycetia bacterium]
MNRTILCLLLLSMLILPLAGCKKGPQKPDGLPELIPCKITLTHGSRPAEGVQVTLIKKNDPSFAWYVGGTTDAAGVVAPVTQDFPGVPTGEFLVLCQKTVTEESTANSAMPTQFSTLPKKYNSMDTTPLSITIGTSPVEQSFDLGEAIHEKFSAPKIDNI